MIESGGLDPTAGLSRVWLTEGKITVADGPFTESNHKRLEGETEIRQRFTAPQHAAKA